MKKFALVLLIALLCLPVLAFAACADPADDPYDLSTKEIGYEIPVYPDCDFSYVVKWTERDPETDETTQKSCTVKITSLTAKLKEKNTIEENETLNDDFYRYVIEFGGTAEAPSFLYNMEFDLYFMINNAGVRTAATLSADGVITCLHTYKVNEPAVYIDFRGIRF